MSGYHCLRLCDYTAIETYSLLNSGTGSATFPENLLWRFEANDIFTLLKARGWKLRMIDLKERSTLEQ